MEKTEKFKMPSATEIESLKKKHGELHQITVEDKEGNQYHCIVRKPKMQDMQVASASEKKKAFTYNLSIFNNCKVACDPAIEQNDNLLLGVLGQLSELVDIAEASIKKI